MQQTPLLRRERRVIALRVTRRWGPARIAHRLGLPVSTTHAVLARHRMPRLRDCDRATGLPLRAARAAERRAVHRYEHEHPGDLLYVDIKKLGRIPDGGGHKVLGRARGKTNRRGMKHGYAYLHTAHR